jgi:hypothetical protein
MTSSFDITESEIEIQFAIRSSSDLTLPLRTFLAHRYRYKGERYLKEFALCAPTLDFVEVAWRVRLFAFGLPGIALNTNILLLISVAVNEHSRNKDQAVAAQSSVLTDMLVTPATHKEKISPPWHDHPIGAFGVGGGKNR